MKRKLLLIIALAVIITGNAFGQEEPVGYNPFVPANLDDLNKMFEVPVVEGSYHRYSIVGDPNYTEMSTFVWYVENGTLGTYDPVGDVWTPATGIVPISNGYYVELSGYNNGTSNNFSDIWVRWNDGTAGNSGYIAVYERSSNNCIFDQQISGWKHLILVPPEVWLLADTREECADQMYSVTAQFDKLSDISYPYILYYSYPGVDGSVVQADTLFNASELDGDNRLHFSVMVNELDNTVNETYVFELIEFRDKFGSYGKIAPLGATANQYPDMTITILHLPQTGTMIMN